MAVSTVKYTLNGQTITLTYDSSTGTYKSAPTAPGASSWNLTDHVYEGTVVATDQAGNTATATTAEFTDLKVRVLEKDVPTISVTYPSAGAYITNSKPTIKWTVTDAESGIDTSTISIKIDSGTAVTSGITTTATTNGYTCQYTPTSALSEGSHTFTFNVSDNDGNAATATSVTCTVDTVPPTLNVSSPAANLVTNNKALTVSGTTNDATSSPVTVTVNGTATAVTNGSFSTSVTLTEGSNTITVIAKDAAGKTTTVTRTVTLDTKAPVISKITITPNPVDAGKTYVVEVTVSD